MMYRPRGTGIRLDRSDDRSLDVRRRRRTRAPCRNRLRFRRTSRRFAIGCARSSAGSASPVRWLMSVLGRITDEDIAPCPKSAKRRHQLSRLRRPFTRRTWTRSTGLRQVQAHFAQGRRALVQNHLRHNRRNPPSIYAHRMRRWLCPILKSIML
jgi:hypothetical protein